MLRLKALAVTLCCLTSASAQASTLRFHWNGANPVEWKVFNASGYSEVTHARTYAGSSDTKDLPAGKYQVRVDAPGFKPYKITIGDRGTLDFTPPVATITFRWRGDTAVRWKLTDWSGRALSDTVNTGSRDSDKMDVAADSFGTRYYVQVDKPGFKPISISVSPRGTTTVEPEAGRLILRRTKSPSMDWVLRDTSGSRLDDGHLTNGSTETLDVAAGDYQLELKTDKEEKLRVTVRRSDTTRVER